MRIRTIRRRRIAGTLALAVTLSAGALAPAAAADGEVGTPLLADPLAGWVGTAGSPLPQASVVDVQGQAFDQALQIDVDAEPSNEQFSGEWSVAAATPTTTAVAAGDAIIADFWIRSTGESTGYRQATFMMEQNGGTFGKSGFVLLPLTQDWQHFTFGFHSKADYAPGEARIKFWLGYGQQTIEVGGMSVLAYGPEDPAHFPVVTYEGREADADWRDAAAQRIEQYRMGDLDVSVVDADGRGVAGADVHVEMLQHDFNFGHAAGAQLLTGTGTDSDNYRDVVLTDVNQVTIDNDLKWGFWRNIEHREAHTLPAIDWLEENDIDLHGHALVWPGWSNSPAYLQDLAPEELRQEVRAHVTDEVSTLTGRVHSWDVVNEPYSEHDIIDVLGREEIVEWFELADAADPAALLLLNEYELLSKWAGNERKQDATYELLADLLAADAPIDGIGIQAHMGTLQPTAPEDLLPVIDRFAGLGLGVHITEFDFRTTDEQLQADYMRDFLTMVFSSPNVDSISTWGFWEGRYSSWEAALYRLDWTQKPNGAAWQDLVLDEWWTDEALVTDGCGAADVRAFLGDYRVTVTVDGVTTTRDVSHTDTEGTSVIVTV